MKKILILQMRPEDEASDSEFDAILRVGGLKEDQADRIRVEQPQIPNIDLNKYYAIIAGGSPYDVSMEPSDKSQTQHDVEQFYDRLFDRVIEQDFPFLGACSGMGLLGRYCSTPISNKYSEPVGSVEVNITEEGQHDPLLKGLPKKFQALVGHKEACDQLPNGAQLLVSSEPCPIQMFRLRNNVYATQFHPEADSNEFILRINIYKNSGYFPSEEADDLIVNVSNLDAPVPKLILKRFIDRFKQQEV
jgi:GMP synthase (glutamine-hydrolysing)